MRASILLASVAMLTAACEAGTLSGTWAWSENLNPAGSSMMLYLGVAGSGVDGTAVIDGIGPHPAIDTLAVTGLYWATTFHLTLTGRNGLLISYAGHLAGDSELRGTWTVAPDTIGATVVFYRQ